MDTMLLTVEDISRYYVEEQYLNVLVVATSVIEVNFILLVVMLLLMNIYF